MHAGRDAREPPGGRPPPKRTYGSKQGSRRVGVRNDQALNQTLSATDEGTNSTKFSVEPPGPELASNRLTSGETYSSGLRSLARPGAGVRYSTADEVSQLVRSAGEGGEEGRACAIALAQACKSQDTRRVIRASGGGILDELTRVILAALRGDGRRQRDEGVIHCLSVALFILSKDRSLGWAFSASVVSILAFLIGGEQHGLDAVHEEEHSGSLTTTATTTAAVGGVARLPTGASSGPAQQRKPTDTKMTGTLSELQQSVSKAGDGRRWRGTTVAAAGQGREPGAKASSSSVFDMSEEEEEEDKEGDGASGGGIGGAVGEGSAARPGVATTKRPPLCFSASNSKGSRVGKAQAVARAADDYGTPKVMVRARMLLDIVDILPWGMANRHLVSAADLGLATLLNIAAQACPEGGKGGGAAGDSAGGGDSESMQDEASTQGSVGSQSDPSSAVGALGDGRAGSETAARKAGVMLELSRLAPSGFLLPLVVGGAAVLKELSASLAVDGAGGAAADPSSLKAVHQLLLALRLLDLATLEQPADGGGGAAKEVGAEDALPGQPAKLTDALLLVVARCRPFHGDARAARRRKESAPDERGRLWAGREKPARQQPLGDEVAARIHECLLAALRVLINITHHDAAVCVEVAARDGLETLMSCLVERCENRSQAAAREGHGRTHSEALLGDIANEGGEALRETNVEDAEGTRGGGEGDGVETDGGDFDAQILTMGALINCVELKESAKNCAIIAGLTVYPRSRVREGSKVGGQLSGAGGLSSKCLAPEFLARLLVRCTRSFARQLQGDRPDQGEEEPCSPSPQAKYGGGITNGPRGDDSTSLEIASKAQSMTPTAAQEAEGEELMSHTEGADLVLGGHCALLLGLLIREQEGSRCTVLSVLPGGKATLIVRVLEAFIALQYQAGVLTEEVVLAVQLLVEELELIEGLPQEDLNPFELDDEDDLLPSGAPATHSTTSPRRPQKRPRSPTDAGRGSTQPSGQWAMDDEEDDGPDEVSFSVADPRATAQGERTSPSWLVQARERGNPRPSGGRQNPPQASTTSASSSTLASDKPITIKIPRDAYNANSTPPRQKNGTPAGSPGSPWRIGGTSIGGTSGTPLGLGLGGGSAAGTRSWLGSSQCRTYGGRRSFGRQTWKKPTRGLVGLRTSMLGQAGSAAGQANTSSAAGNGIGGGVGGGGGGGVGPMSGRRRTAAGTNPILDLDGWSDSSNETPIKLNDVGSKNAAMEAKRARAACAHYSIKNGVVNSACGGVGGGSGGGGGGGGGAAGNATEVAAQARSEDRRTCALSLRPSQEDDGRGPFQGGGASNGGVGGGKRATYGAASGAPSAKTRPGPVKARREENPQPQTGGEAGSTLYGSSSGTLPQRISSQFGQGLKGARDALRPPLGVGGGVRGQAVVSEELKDTRGVFQADHAEREDAGGRERERAASRNVFEFDEEESD